MTENEISKEVVDAAYKIHTRLGPGLLESAYQTVMLYELQKRGLATEREVAVPIQYDDLILETAFRADIIVEKKVIVELKSVEMVSPVYKKQLLTYLKLMDKRLGLLINFGDILIKNGITRIVNNLSE
jgi:GxxExxY protein